MAKINYFIVWFALFNSLKSLPLSVQLFSDINLVSNKTYWKHLIIDRKITSKIFLLKHWEHLVICKKEIAIQYCHKSIEKSSY